MWTLPKDNLPNKSEWYVCYVSGQRTVLRWIQPNQFWVELGGKTYSPYDIERWLNDAQDKIYVAIDDERGSILEISFDRKVAAQSIIDMNEMRMGGASGEVFEHTLR